jgi:hypothetical protein
MKLTSKYELVSFGRNGIVPFDNNVVVLVRRIKEVSVFLRDWSFRLERGPLQRQTDDSLRPHRCENLLRVVDRSEEEGVRFLSEDLEDCVARFDLSILRCRALKSNISVSFSSLRFN